MKNEAKITTIVGKGCVLNGDFTVDGSVRMDGIVEGNMQVTGHLILGANAKIDGDVEAQSAMLGGEVYGDIRVAEKTELLSTAKVIGNIHTAVIVIDEKAIFQGMCDMNQEGSSVKRKHPVRETRAGKRSAKEALVEALKEAEKEALSDSEQDADRNE